MGTQVINFNEVENVVFEDKEVETLKLNDSTIWETFKKLESFIDGSITEIKAEDLEGITSLPDYAFAGCLKLKSVTLPDGLITIGNYIIYNFNTDNRFSLDYLEIPATVISMGAMYVNTLKMLGNNPPTLNSSTSLNSVKKVLVPNSVLETYKNAEYWSEYSSIIEGY